MTPSNTTSTSTLESPESVSFHLCSVDPSPVLSKLLCSYCGSLFENYSPQQSFDVGSPSFKRPLCFAGRPCRRRCPADRVLPERLPVQLSGLAGHSQVRVQLPQPDGQAHCPTSQQCTEVGPIATRHSVLTGRQEGFLFSSLLFLLSCYCFSVTAARRVSYAVLASLRPVVGV
jgi:hypothetical protein